MKPLKPLFISGREVLPLIEGGKGVAVSTGKTAGAWAAENAVGTISGVIPDVVDKDGNVIPMETKAKSRRERFEEQVRHSIEGCISQAKLAYEISNGLGRIHLNVLWEQGGAITILEEALAGAKGLIHGVTCGAGMPYKLAQIASSFKTFYYPIVSSGRAFKALWARAYHSYKEFLGGVVYEDPWKAGGHIGLSNSEDPNVCEDPYPRVLALRKAMKDVGLDDTPIIIAGGVWYLREFERFIDNPEIGPTAFQFGTRPLLTKESPVAEAWQKILLGLKPGDVVLQRFSPTGFASSAVRNDFLNDLFERSATAMDYKDAPEGEYQSPLEIGRRKIYVADANKARADEYFKNGRTVILRVPDNQIVFVTPTDNEKIQKARVNCMGCISQCLFSGWSQSGANNSTGKEPDSRYFCIQEKLYRIAHGFAPEHELMFAGANAVRFATDPFFKDGRLPTVKEFIARLLTGD